MGWSVFRPIGPRVLVKLDPPVRSFGSIVIPDNLTDAAGAPSRYRGGAAAQADRWGTVVAVGNGHWECGESAPVLQPIGIAVGERVCFGMYNGVQIPAPDDDPDGEYWVMDTRGKPDQGYRFADVYGVLEEEGQAAQ